ncbi:MAG: glycoside hydrolase family 15 protein [Candidatus Dormibacter sp.]
MTQANVSPEGPEPNTLTVVETRGKPPVKLHPPIGDYALLSDCQGSALVSRSGSIDWACLPRFDSPATFARILGTAAGHWLISPTGEVASVTREYLAGTMVLRTTFKTSTGRVALTDAMPLAPNDRDHQIGKRSPHGIVRTVEGLEGTVEVEFELAPRPEYGLTVPILERRGAGVTSRGGPIRYLVSSTVPLQSLGGIARARFSVAHGEHQSFALRTSSPWDHSEKPWPAAEIRSLLEGTVAGWRSWSKIHQSYRGPYADLVHHSGRVLQALTYAPTGAIVAAPTTSLPERIGGSRNWDYRYTWVRDASLTMEALWVAACPDEAADFFDFFAIAAGGIVDGASPLQILYGVGGERLVAESELSHLPGYRGSRPVRIGNGAWNQVQLDVFGGLLSAAALLAGQVGKFSPATAAFLAAVADTAAGRWTEPDQGIWEVRGGPQHFLHSKLMCWVALDRAIELAPLLEAAQRIAYWKTVRDRIKTAILEQGWSQNAGAYAQAFGSDHLDASVLRMAIVGFLPANDPRMRATIDAIAQRLTDARGFVYRYRSADGLEGGEGTFAICTFWLVRCLALLGETARARELYERICGYANDVGLMSEEVDPASGELLGNFPQAFTHIGLVNAAWAIALAEGKASWRGGPSGEAQAGSTRSFDLKP